MKTEINKIATLVKDLSGVDVFEDRRTRKHVEGRALLNFMLRNHFGMTLYQIKDYYLSKGKNYDHATALFSLNNFEMYKKYSKELDGWLDVLKRLYTDDELDNLKRETIKTKIDYISNDYVNRIYRIVNHLPMTQLTKKE
jgi:hypothetical protein|tara:strand:+ start:764 stop:1183 length:420 start_codon:yes stop_codon:yes gene_type:complete